MEFCSESSARCALQSETASLLPNAITVCALLETVPSGRRLWGVFLFLHGAEKIRIVISVMGTTRDLIGGDIAMHPSVVCFRDAATTLSDLTG